MTVTWPIPPNSTIDPRTRPIPFQAERDVTAVSVSFGNRRAEERAYRDGAFVWPYLRSTRAGNLFTLVRDDGDAGWPADPKPFVDEEPPPPLLPTGGQSYGAIYELDFTAQPTQNLNIAPGSAVIDGLTWWAKNALGQATMSIVNGSGLEWWSHDPSPPVARLLGLPLANVPNFNPSAPVQIWAAMKRNSGNNGVYVGLIDAPANNAAFSSMASVFMISFAYPNSNSYSAARSNGNSGFSGPEHGTTCETCMIGVHAFNAWVDTGICESGYTGGALPPLDPWVYGSSYYTTGRAAMRASPMLALQGAYLANYTVKKIAILQPKVAA